MQTGLFQRKTGKWVFLSVPTELSVGTATVSHCESVKNCFFVCYSLVCLMAYRTKYSGSSFLRWGSWKSGCYVWDNFSVFREKLRFGVSLLIVWHCASGRVWPECVSDFLTYFSVGILSFPQYVGVTQLVPIFLSERIVPCMVIY